MSDVRDSLHTRNRGFSEERHVNVHQYPSWDTFDNRNCCHGHKTNGSKFVHNVRRNGERVNDILEKVIFTKSKKIQLYLLQKKIRSKLKRQLPLVEDCI